MNNIMLTGAKQVGKSTIINKIIKAYSYNICGFQTLLDKETQRFYMQSMNDKYSRNKKEYICRKGGNNRWVGLTNTFDYLGASILTDCLNSSPNLIVMDELGVFENYSFRFHELVYQCFDSSIPVLGVLKNKSSLFLDTIKKRSDIVTYTITKENRNQVYRVVTDRLKQFNNN